MIDLKKKMEEENKILKLLMKVSSKRKAIKIINLIKENKFNDLTEFEEVLQKRSVAPVKDYIKEMKKLFKERQSGNQKTLEQSKGTLKVLNTLTFTKNRRGSKKLEKEFYEAMEGKGLTEEERIEEIRRIRSLQREYINKPDPESGKEASFSELVKDGVSYCDTQYIHDEEYEKELEEYEEKLDENSDNTGFPTCRVGVSIYTKKEDDYFYTTEIKIKGLSKICIWSHIAYNYIESYKENIQLHQE